MSHHLDTPLASQNGQLYIDDLYVFRGDGTTVFVMDVNSNVTGVHVQPGFHREARYEFKMHTAGADVESLRPTGCPSVKRTRTDGNPCSCTFSPMRRRMTMAWPVRSSSKAAPGNRQPEAATPGSGPDASPTRATSTCRCSASSTPR